MLIKKATSNYDFTEYDQMVWYASGSYTVTLPHARGSGRELWIVNTGTGAITVQPQTLETIQTENNAIIYQFAVIHIIDLETQKWMII